MTARSLLRKVGLVFVANLLLVPILGTFAVGLLSGDPRLVLGTDIAGVPVLVYATMSTAIPVIAVTVFGLIILGELGKPGPRRQYIAVVAVVFGAAGGALFGLLLFGGFRIAFAGLLTGTICSVVDVLIWRASTGTADLA